MVRVPASRCGLKEEQVVLPTFSLLDIKKLLSYRPKPNEFVSAPIAFANSRSSGDGLPHR